MADSIQTDNRSALQVAIELGVDQQLARIEQAAPLPALFDAMKAPEQFLVSLAIERGVVDWSEDDSERVRRKTIREAMRLHQLSCTRMGIQKSIETLGFNAYVTRVRPYVLSVDAEIESAALTDELLHRILRRVGAYKAGRDTIELSLIRSSAVEQHIVGIVQTGIMSDSEAYRLDEVALSTETYIGVVSNAAVISDSEPYNIAFSDPTDITIGSYSAMMSACYVISDTKAGI